MLDFVAAFEKKKKKERIFTHFFCIDLLELVKLQVKDSSSKLLPLKTHMYLHFMIAVLVLRLETHMDRRWLWLNACCDDVT